MKPEPRKKAKARGKRQEKALKAKVRADIWQRSQGRCELCGRPVNETEGQWHHDPSKAKTRGMAPEHRHTLAGGARSHVSCHQQITDERWEVVFDSELLRFNGGYRVIEKPSRFVLGGTILRQEARV